ncbi:acyltransferase [Hymenobacter sp. YC55]|uniref:acyltransferase family protein n=1 Tax=Hymenobacter sp. YC55 TaxID=3034019 RepID=UPI0023F75FD9|nr:acyltransferase [Hymenobacter sp. YC55]MDF7810496.1 acyltransferase [Hymenobacter sp. YC55]
MALSTLAAPTNSIPTAASHKNNNFNFLRLFFASLVLISHAPQLRDGDYRREPIMQFFGTTSAGELAVYGFFLLSGYLIVGSWQRKTDLLYFLNKRVRRIYPAFIVAIIISVFIVGPLAVPDVAAYFQKINYRWLISGTMKLRPPEQTNGLAFAGQPSPFLNGAVWTIAYEFRCYVITALVGLLGLKRQKPVWVSLLVISLAFTLVPADLLDIPFPGRELLIDNPNAFFRHLSMFSAGACFYFFRGALPATGRKAALVGIVLFALLFLPVPPTVALSTLGAYFLFWVAFARISFLDSFQNMSDISYGVYLYGWPIQKLLEWYFPTVSVWVLVVVAFGLCCVMGAASWHLIEKHFIAGQRRQA